MTPVGAEGASLLPLLDGTPPASWRDRFLIEHLTDGKNPPSYCAVRTTRYKYVRYSTGEEELYDLQSDPFELQSRHADASMASVLTELRADTVTMCSPPPPGLHLLATLSTRLRAPTGCSRYPRKHRNPSMRSRPPSLADPRRRGAGCRHALRCRPVGRRRKRVRAPRATEGFAGIPNDAGRAGRHVRLDVGPTLPGIDVSHWQE